MKKTETIGIRVDDETKARIAKAAAKKGVSMTTFIVDAATREAARIEARPESKVRFSGVPSFFRGLCAEATNGGKSTYRGAGYELSRALPQMVPYSCEPSEWDEALQALELLISESSLSTRQPQPEDYEAVWEWFIGHLPKCVALVPKRRMTQFISGVVAGFEDEIVR